MRKFLLSISFALSAVLTHGQTVATFESLTLPKSDTAYVNYSKFGIDVGFSDGLAYFPCVYDTSFGYEFWSSGFAYSNMTDSVTSGFMNQYSAKTAKGFAASNNYLVAYGVTNKIKLTGTAIGKSILGFYVTNSTYAYNSMRDGDGFSKKFSASAKDFFRLDVFAYRKDTIGKDSVSFYLADFRFSDSSFNYIIKDWQWVDLAKLGKVDSLMFRLQSSDNGSFGMNTPAYFCMDNFMTNESGLKIELPLKDADLKIYPNPSNDVLNITSSFKELQTIEIVDLFGRKLDKISFINGNLSIDVSSYTPGVYMLIMTNGSQMATHRFVKQ